jgi:hypothetical protein
MAVNSKRSSRRAGGTLTTAPELDADSRKWIDQLRVGHPRYNETVGRLHDLLRRVAGFELSRRRRYLLWITGPEFADLAQQAADDALVNVLARLDDFRGLSRFTTWAYKFVVFEVSAKVAQHAWRRHPPGRGRACVGRAPRSCLTPTRGPARAAGATRSTRISSTPGVASAREWPPPDIR